MQVETLDPNDIKIKQKRGEFDLDVTIEQDNKSRKSGKSGFLGSQYNTVKINKSKPRTRKQLLNTQVLNPKRDGSRVSLRSAKSYNVKKSLTKNLSKYLRNDGVSSDESSDGDDEYDSEEELFSDENHREEAF